MALTPVLKTVGVTSLGGMLLSPVIIKPQTEDGARAKNRFDTIFSLGALATTPYLAKELVVANPKMVNKLALKTGTLAERAILFVEKKAPVIIERIKGSKLGAKVFAVCAGAAKKVVVFVKNNKVLKSVADKAILALEKFVKSPVAKKGKIALLAAGIALLTLAVLKSIANYYKREGAIDYEYLVLNKVK
ncbi:hypothetical protein IKR55_03505 [bacterium]|nr:hypothetical protein [bacterium]